MSRRQVPHQADIAIEVSAPTREALFREALAGMIEYLTEGQIDLEAALSESGESSPVTLLAVGDDDEDKLVAILSEVLYSVQNGDWFPVGVGRVKFDGPTVQASIFAQHPDSDHQLAREIKAVTYHHLKIEHKQEWSARIVFDV